MSDFVGYILTAPSLPSKEEQLDALVSAGFDQRAHPLYEDKGKRRDQLEDCFDALCKRGTETLIVSTVGVLGSGDTLHQHLNRLSGQAIKLHMCDTGETVLLDENAVKVAALPMAAKRENMARRASMGGNAAAGRSGAKLKLSEEDEVEAARMWTVKHRTGAWMYSIEEVAAHFNVSAMTIRRRLGNAIHRDRTGADQ